MIDKSISYSEFAQIHINKYDYADHNYWNVQCNENKIIRKEIREYYRDKQEFHCAYCNRLRQDFNGAQWDIDHIIPKQSHPQYLYTPRNLTVTCKDCNGIKAKKNVLTESIDASQSFPITKDSYIIIHPHYDNYADNIICLYTSDGRVYHIPRTHKGQKTFDICGLIRFTEAITETVEINDDTGTLLCLIDEVTLKLKEILDRQLSVGITIPPDVFAILLKGQLDQIVSSVKR